MSRYVMETGLSGVQTGMTRTVLLNCPIKAEITAVDSQSDLRFCHSFDLFWLVLYIILLTVSSAYSTKL